MKSSGGTPAPTPPGEEIVIAGIADLEAGRDTAEADAVLMAATRLRAAGTEVPPTPGGEPPAHRYEKLAAQDPRSAHSRYNAIVCRVASFARAAERARAS